MLVKCHDIFIRIRVGILYLNLGKCALLRYEILTSELLPFGTKLKLQFIVFAVFTKSLCHIMEVMHGPLIQSLESRLEQNNAKIAELEKRQAEIQKLIDSS